MSSENSPLQASLLIRRSVFERGNSQQYLCKVPKPQLVEPRQVCHTRNSAFQWCSKLSMHTMPARLSHFDHDQSPHGLSISLLWLHTDWQMKRTVGSLSGTRRSCILISAYSILLSNWHKYHVVEMNSMSSMAWNLLIACDGSQIVIVFKIVCLQRIPLDL